ncbi:MAG: DUF4364 family protein [Clostridia bacterium]|nr:DUF4364 family protein [Clostridia bacterium]
MTGGLTGKLETKILVLYTLRAGGGLDFDDITAVLLSQGLVNYFELSQAVEELLRAGHIDHNNGRAMLTPLGEEALREFDGHIPYSVREKAFAALLKLSAARRRKRAIPCEVVPCGNGYEVTAALFDGDLCLMRLSLYADCEIQAQRLRKNFEEAPEDLYLSIVERLSSVEKAEEQK